MANLTKFSSWHRQLGIFSAHLGLIITSNLLAFYLRFEGNIPADHYTMIVTTLPLIVLVRLGTFYAYGIHHGSLRYAGIRDLLNIFKAVSISSVTLVMFIYFFMGLHKYPRSVFVLDWLILIMLMGGLRMRLRIFRELRAMGSEGKKRVLLVGAGDAGEMILREINQNPNLLYSPIGFIDDDIQKSGLKIHGIPVLGTRRDLEKISMQYSIESIIITIASAKAVAMQKIVEDCLKTGVELKIIPGIGQILHGHASVSQIRDVQVEDLLYREVVKTDTTNIGEFINGKSVLVTGAAGSIGSELCHQIAKFGPRQIILFDQAESSLYFTELELRSENPGVSVHPIIGDLQNYDTVMRTFKHWKPEIIFHSAAYKHVPLLEQNPSEAVKNNIFSTRNLAIISNKFGVEKFVLISTDKAVNPTSVMGATKRLAELYIQELSKQSKTNFVVVRFGNVLGSNGSVIPLFKKQIEKKGPVTVTHPEMRRYFMTIPEAVQLVLQASMMGKDGEIFVLDMGEQVKIWDLARQMITLSGYVPEQDIKIIFSGLRPGEKLQEELFGRLEKVEDTNHDKIKKAIGYGMLSLESLNSKIDELEQVIELGEDGVIVNKLKEVVSDYNGDVTQKS